MSSRSQYLSKTQNLLNFVLKSRKIHQKDNKHLWNNLFSENSWKGSESAIINPIKMYGKDLGFILCRIDHFKNISDSDLSSFKNLSDFLSYNIQNLDEFRLLYKSRIK